MKYLDLKRGERVLDAGCGIGYYSFELATKFGCEVDGVDIDTDDIEIAKKIGDMTRVMNANFKVCDISELNFPDNTFDEIILSEVLEHVRDDKKILNELHRVLKPHGHLIISTPYVDIVEEYSEQKPKLSGKKTGFDIEGGHVRNGYSFELLSKILNDTGFNVVAYCFIGKKFTIRAGFPMFLIAYPISMLDKFIKGVGNGIVLKAEKR
jgi:SAM-dependent methyltransferase